MRKKLFERFFAVFLALTIVVNLLPAAAMVRASEDDSGGPVQSDQVDGNSSPEVLLEETEELEAVPLMEEDLTEPAEEVVMEETLDAGADPGILPEEQVDETEAPQVNDQLEEAAPETDLETDAPTVEETTEELSDVAPLAAVPEDTPIGNDWVLGDFIYDGNKVLGFSASGLEKLKTQKNLVLPHLNPADGTPIDTVGENPDDATAFRSKGLVTLTDYANNIRVIEGRYSATSSAGRSKGEFKGNQLNSVQLDGLEIIGPYAFNGNKSLKEISFPNVVEVGASAFSSGGLVAIDAEDLPKLETVGDSAFAFMTSLTKAHLPAVKTVGTYSFGGDSISDAYFPSLIEAGTNAFKRNKLAMLTNENFPVLEIIGDGAFNNNLITEFNLPTLRRLEDTSSSAINSTFGYNPGLVVANNFPNLEYVGAYTLVNLGITELDIPNLAQIGTGAFLNNPGLEEYDGKVVIWTLNDSVGSKENYLVNPVDQENDGDWNEMDFTWDAENPNRVTGFTAKGLNKAVENNNVVVLPDRAEIVAASAFESPQLADVDGDGVKDGLVSIQGNRVQIIEGSAFYNNDLTDINESFPMLREIQGTWAFGANHLTSLNLPLLENVPAYTFSGNSITDVSLDSVVDIGERAFSGSPVENLFAPVLKTIGKAAFWDHNLTELNLPSVEEIGLVAFSRPSTTSAASYQLDYTDDGKISGYADRPLTVVNLPNVKIIAPLAFAGNSIKSLSLPTVTDVGRRAFDSNSINELNLPAVLTIGDKAFRGNLLDEAHVNSNVEAISQDAFWQNRNKNSTKHETMVLLTNYENPNGIEDGYVAGVRHHIVNPTKVTVHYVDTEGNVVADSFTEYILAEKTYDAINIFNYTVDMQTQVVEDNRQENEIYFTYTVREPAENTQGIELRQANELDANTSLPKERYYIGDTMTTNVYLDLTGIDASYSEGVIKIYYDYRYIDDESVRVITEGAQNVKGYQAHNGVLEIYLDNISGGYQLELPIEWKFNRYVTPDNYRLELNTQFENAGEILSTTEPIYLEGYYRKPSMTKTSPLNLPDYDYENMSSSSNGPRYMGVLGPYVSPDNEYEYKVVQAAPVRYNFYFTNLERNISRFVITDTLPTYTAVKEDGTTEERLAVFDPVLNPAWSLSDDGLTVTQSKTFPGTRSVSSLIEPLYLSYPDLKSGANVVNSATVELVPDNQGINENVMRATDSLSIYTGFYENVVYEGDPRFMKEVKTPRYDSGSSRAYFYDTAEDRAKVIPYIVRVSSMAQLSDLVDVTITDYGLDERLYYYGISFPLDSHTAGNLPVTVIAYDQAGDKMDPANDPQLFNQMVVMSTENQIVFPEESAKDIDYVQLVFPEDHKIFSAIEISVETKLRDPAQPVYSSPGYSTANLFRNHAVMSGNLYVKHTDVPASERTDPILDEDGVAISNYSEEWDNIPGNYMWHERAEVQVRDFHAEIGLVKSQSYSTSRALTPGEEGYYQLNLSPRIYQSSGAPRYGVNLDVPFENFELIDLMPKGVSPTAITLSSGFANSGGSYELIENYENTGRLAIIFRAEVLAENVYAIARIDTVIENYAPDGFITNEAYETFDIEEDAEGVEKITRYGTKTPPPGDTSGRVWLKDQRSIRIIKAKEMAARKYIKKASDLGWSDIGIITESEEALDYRLSLVNNLDTPRTFTEIVDFFPYVGDVSIQEENIGNGVRPERESAFENTYDLTRNVQIKNSSGVDVTADYDISYWNSETPVDYQGQSADDVIANFTWSTAPSETTRGIKVTAKEGVELASGESVDVIIPMRAPKNDTSNDFALTGMRAWNSYVRKDQETIRFVEPNKVYNEMAQPLGTIEFTKFGQIGLESTEVTPLAGARFQLLRVTMDKEGVEQTEVIQTQVSDADGVVRFINLNILDSYRIRELESADVRPGNVPGKYILPDQAVDFSYEDFKAHYEANDNFDLVLTDQESQELFLNVQPIYGNVSIEKINADGNTMQYIHFELRGLSDHNSDYLADRYTDTNGRASFLNLIEGEYELRELPVTSGTKVDSGTSYEAIEPIRFTIDKDNRDIQFTGDAAIVNSSIQLVINKVGVSSVEEIPTQEELRIFTDAGLDKLPGFQFTITEVDNPTNVITTEMTSLDGFVLVKGLKANTLYEISEIDVDHPEYKHNDATYRFMVTDKTQIVDENGNPFVQPVINFANAERDKTGDILLEKVDEQGAVLEGAVFELVEAQTNEVLDQATSGADGKATFTDLPYGDYIIREKQAPSGYQLLEEELLIRIDQPEQVISRQITNIKLISISGVKTWDDANNQDGLRPDSITIRLLADGVEVDSRTVTAEDDWAGTFTDLDEKRAGERIVYTVEEVPVGNGYETEVRQVEGTSSFVITNSRTPKTPPPEEPSTDKPPTAPPAKPPAPKTGDDGSFLLWGSLMLASLAGFVFLGKKRKNRGENS